MRESILIFFSLIRPKGKFAPLLGIGNRSSRVILVSLGEIVWALPNVGTTGEEMFDGRIRTFPFLGEGLSDSSRARLRFF